MTITIWMGPVFRSAAMRKRATRAQVLRAVARVFPGLYAHHLHPAPAEPSRRPGIPSFIVYDVLDVIDRNGGAN
jgi:hypothetical protein